MKRLAATVSALVMLFASLGPAASAAESVPEGIGAAIAANKTSGIYLVLLSDAPVVAYEGGVEGFAPTRSAEGQKADVQSAAATSYRTYLETTHEDVLQSAGIAASAKIYDYTVASNGFAARLSEADATRLAQQPGVLAVVTDEIRQLTTDSSPAYLDLTHQQGAWATGYTGEDIVIGVIDTGIWPEHPSFADTGLAAPTGFAGTACEFGSEVSGAQGYNDSDADFVCNNKLVSAQVFGEGYHGGAGIGIDPGEYLSARDADGHGTHTASTAGGNADVPATVLGAEWGEVSGIAPDAHIAAYKACWNSAPDSGGCAVSDLVAAIDQAVADGVDVINYSIGSSSSTLGADDLSFLFAADAGVMVATSAGNNGPSGGTIGSPATVPWVTSVAAGTQDRDFGGTAVLGDSTVVEGVTLTGGLDEVPLVDAADLGNELCDPAVTFSGPIEGSIVLCTRGGFARVSKSLAVSQQGGAGMILANADDAETLNTDNHYVPSLHVSATDGAAIGAYIDAAGLEAVASLSGGEKVEGQGSVVASFSSRGPNGLSEDILKPDVTAPGVNILAGNTPTALLGAPDQLFQAISGTSMASPHVAGVFALLKQAHPEWSPAMAKSALATTARHDVWITAGVTQADVFDMGSGYIQPGGNIHARGSAFNPGLVYDADLFDYAAFTCGAGLDSIWQTGTCEGLADAGYSTDPSDLNVPAVGIAELVGSQTVTRTVTSVADKLRVFEARVSAPAGFTVEVEPSTITLGPGESADFTMTITRTRAPLGEWRFGALTWRSADYRIESRIAVRGFEFSSSSEVAASGTTGDATFDVDFGYSGEYAAAAHGPAPANTSDGVVLDDPSNDINTALATGVGVTSQTVAVAEDTAYARFSLFDEYTDGDDDLDLYVFGPDGSFVGASGSGTSAEQVDVPFPAAGDYTVIVHGWQTDGPDAAYILFSWSVPAEPDGTLIIDSAPTSATMGETSTVAVSWDGLAADASYLGAVSHTGPNGLLDITLVTIDTAAPSQSSIQTPIETPVEAPGVGASL